MTSIIEYSPVAQSGFAAAARHDGGTQTDSMRFEAAHQPPAGRPRFQAAAPVAGDAAATTTAFEQQLLARTAELRAAHSALEAISFMVARDLREPLKTIDEFGALLARRAQTLDPTLMANCERMRAASQRMRVMVCGLLDLSRGLAAAPRDPATSDNAGSDDCTARLSGVPGAAPSAQVRGVTPTPAAPIPAAAAAQAGPPAAALASRRARLLRDLALVSPGGVLIFALGLALIGISTAIL